VSWVDFPDLVRRDVERDYPYFLVVGEDRRRVTLCDGALTAGGVSLDDLPPAPEQPDWWQINTATSCDTVRHAATRGLDWRDVVPVDELRVPR
jgi:hypothetical protein